MPPKATSLYFATLRRDLSVLTQRRLFWWALALWSAICTLVFFSYLESFLDIQPQLRAKNFRYGVTDLVMMPYVKALGLVAMLFVIGLCSRLFFNEHFSAFGVLYRSANPRPLPLLAAKWGYVAGMALTLVGLLALPPLVSRFFFDFHLSRVILTLLAQFVLLFSVGMLAAVLSQVFRHSILVMLTACLAIGLPELAVRLIAEPAWLLPVLEFFSALAHSNRIATGVITLSDGVYFLLWWWLLSAIAQRQFNNTYLLSS
ncbi:MAG: hypothetical protein CR974_04215 [Gammaproteobacteria bacterium]|nr:MAG: hypothetical protein CR974_04215 [Gammaproteobacteria bacterium]